MRIIWKDTVKPKTPRRYRGFTVYGIGNGWATTMPDDDNIYRSYTDANNAIDKTIGGHGKGGPVDRIGGRISIVGNVNEL